ncbi:iron complex outermembrane receptor protein [Nitrobacteraceae bacterium AZCC 1564]
MSICFFRASLAGCSVVALALCVSGPTQAQQADQSSSAEAGTTALPEVVVRAPSPIVRRRPHRAAAGGTAPAATPAPEPAQDTTDLPGTLPIVTDQFATVTVVPNEEIRRSGAATLGDLLNNKPGVTGSSFAPGASSRPIIRGLDVNRVGIVENGLGGGGASDLGEDHFVPIDPLSTNQVEVIRGPATLRYGSQAIGGVVSSTNNRIPESSPCSALPTMQTYGYNVKAPQLSASNPCASFETRTSISSVDLGREGAVLLDAGGNNFAIHVDAFDRKAEDYSIPGAPYLSEPNFRPGKQPNSAASANGFSVGGSYFFAGGFIGAAVTQNNALYHIPGIDGAEHQTRIDGKQTKVAIKGEYRPDTAAIDAIRFWLGATDYKHNEIGLADPTDFASDGVRQTFTNKEQEGRVEVQLAPYNLPFATLTTAVGVQASHQELTAPSPDDPGSQFNGLWDPNHNTKVAGYIFNEFKFSETTKAQVAGRIEHVDLDGTTPEFPASFLGIDPVGPNMAHNPKYTPKSGSIGLIQNLPLDLSASLTAQYVERAPKPAELFSRGPHDATGTFDIGNPNLNIETAQTVEAGLRRATGPFRFELTGYYTRFNGFIFRNLTGVMCDEDFASCGNPMGELKQAIYSQRNAIFRGGEFQFQYDALPVWGGIFGIEGQYDIVRATFTDGTNVPRIPPQRLGGGFYYRDDHWLARINLLHAFAQNDVSGVETPTAGYNRLRAEVSYTTKLAKDSWLGPREFIVGIVGDNLLNEDIRNSVSYNKDEVLMPGLGVRMFANVKF